MLRHINSFTVLIKVMLVTPTLMITALLSGGSEPQRWSSVEIVESSNNILYGLPLI